MAEKLALILIAKDGNEDNAKHEQFKVYQRDGVTVRVAVGIFQEVPLWVAERAQEIGDIEGYKIIEDKVN